MFSFAGVTNKFSLCSRLSTASMTSYSPIWPDESAQIDSELRGARGETIPLERPDPPVPVQTRDELIVSTGHTVLTEHTVFIEPASLTSPADSALSLRFWPPPDAPFQSSLSLEIRCEAPDARVHYALGSNTVDENGLIFDLKDPILLTQSTLVAARAFRNGELGPLLWARFEIVKPAWQELEPAEQSDQTSHKASENLACADGWRFGAGSVRGKLHAHRGSWREDSFALAQVETQSGVWSVVAVSDGAGSAPLSRVGSKVACAAAMEALRNSLGAIETLAEEQDKLVARDLPVLKAALVGAGAASVRALESEAQTRGKPLTAFAATLLVLVRREWQGAQLCVALQVGDGAVGLWDGEAVTLLGEADHGQSSGETRFLTTHGMEAELAGRVKFSIKRELQALAVMSDGVSDDFFPEAARLGELFAAVTPLVQNTGDAGAALVSWLGYEKRGSSDDRTLVVGWPQAAGM